MAFFFFFDNLLSLLHHNAVLNTFFFLQFLLLDCFFFIYRHIIVSQRRCILALLYRADHHYHVCYCNSIGSWVHWPVGMCINYYPLPFSPWLKYLENKLLTEDIIFRVLRVKHLIKAFGSTVVWLRSTAGRGGSIFSTYIFGVYDKNIMNSVSHYCVKLLESAIESSKMDFHTVPMLQMITVV